MNWFILVCQGRSLNSRVEIDKKKWKIRKDAVGGVFIPCCSKTVP